MPAIIIEQETHPDRIIETAIGTFRTYEEADRIAKDLYDHPRNRIGNDKHNKMYNYRAFELMALEQRF